MFFCRKKVLSGFVLISIFGSFNAFSADTESDFNAARTRINTIQTTDPILPSTVPDQKGSVGYVLSRMFDANGKIGNWFLKALGTRSNNAVLRWSGDETGQFIEGSIFDNGTNVGIGGVSSATYKLNVEGNTRINSGILEFTGLDNSYIRFRNAADNDHASIGITNGGIAISGLSSHSGNEHLFVSNSSNIGIGNTNPNYKLDVSGDINFTGDIRKNGTILNLAGKFQDGATTGEVYYNGGNVGIGNTNPNYTLDVTGTINATNLRGNGSQVTNISGDSITDNTIDSSEIEDNTIGEDDISDNFVARDSSLLDGVDSNRILTQKADIPGSHNLDAYTTTGLYHQNSNANAVSGSNYPVNLAGMLQVVEDGVQLYQKYHVYGPFSDIYIRTRNNATWESWKKLLAEGDSGDLIADGTIDSSEIQDNTLTTSDLATNSVGNDELIDSPTFQNIVLENGISTITANDGGGNAQLRFGHDYTTSDERFTQGGTAAFIGTNTDNTVAGSEYLDLKVSLNAGAGNDAAVAWGNTLRVGPTDLVWGGNNVLTAGDSIPGDSITDNTIDSSEIQDNTITASDLADNSVGNLELIANPSFTELTLDNQEPTDLTSDGNLGFDSSRGLILYRTQEVGQASGDGAYTVLDTSNITGGDGISISNTNAGISGLEPIEFSLDRTLTYTDNVGDVNYTGLTIDHNASGSDTLAADRTHRGFRLDLDSSATGGNTTDEHRVYGIESDVDVTGDSDLVFGGIFDARANVSSGTVTALRGSYSLAVANGSSTVTSLEGVNNLAQHASTANNTNTIATVSRALKTSASTGLTSNHHGAYNEAEVDAGTVTNAYATRSIIDRDGGTITNGYLFHGDYQGTLPTNAYGIYIVDPVDNYFAGNVGIGTTAPLSKLHISGGTGDASIRLTADTNNSGEDNNPLLLLQQDGGGIDARFGIVGSAGQIYASSIANAAFLSADNNSTTPLQLVTNGTARVTVEGGGDVGIGITNPTQRLDVNGKIRMRSQTTTSDSTDTVATKGYVDSQGITGCKIRYRWRDETAVNQPWVETALSTGTWQEGPWSSTQNSNNNACSSGEGCGIQVGILCQ